MLPLDFLLLYATYSSRVMTKQDVEEPGLARSAATNQHGLH